MRISFQGFVALPNQQGLPLRVKNVWKEINKSYIYWSKSCLLVNLLFSWCGNVHSHFQVRSYLKGILSLNFWDNDVVLYLGTRKEYLIILYLIKFCIDNFRISYVWLIFITVLLTWICLSLIGFFKFLLKFDIYHSFLVKTILYKLWVQTI